MKLLLYCTKAKPYLYKTEDTTYPAYPIGYHTDKDLKLKLSNTNELANLNGKIVAECDFEVEWYDTFWHCVSFTERKGLEKSCLTAKQLFDYVKGRNEFYAIHIKNLHIFDKPKELNDYNYLRTSFFGTLGNAPQNMMYAYDNGEKKILISIRPEWLCKILNGEKTIEVRKKVLKGMLK